MSDIIPYMGLIDIFYPKICVGCHREGEYICQECQKKLSLPGQICPMCCKPNIDGYTHPRCKTKLGMDRLIVGLSYKGMVQDCLKKVKYKSSWDILSFLYEISDQDTVISDQEIIVTFVPMWREKERMRGYNQASILADLVASHYKGRILAILERTRATKPMYGLDRQKRGENIKDAFAISDTLLRQGFGGQAVPQKVILVDDVWTTGETMSECARVLKMNGIKEIWGITLAR